MLFPTSNGVGLRGMMCTIIYVVDEQLSLVRYYMQRCPSHAWAYLLLHYPALAELTGLGG